MWVWLSNDRKHLITDSKKDNLQSEDEIMLIKY